MLNEIIPVGVSNGSRTSRKKEEEEDYISLPAANEAINGGRQAVRGGGSGPIWQNGAPMMLGPGQRDSLSAQLCLC